MGVVMSIISYFGAEEDNVYDTMRRLRMAEYLDVPLPPTIERYFEKSLIPTMRYHHNIYTMATDGPSIIRISNPDIGISKSRMYVENLFYAMPSYQPEEVRTRMQNCQIFSPEVVKNFIKMYKIRILSEK